MFVPSNHYLLGPALTLLALGIILLLCRWVFSTADRDERLARRLAAERSGGEYGLLVPVATAQTCAQASALRDLLHDAGLRCTLAERPQAGTFAVLVFRADLERARALVSR